METNVPPRMYTEPPAFDIQVDDFATLPLRRLEAFRLLRSGLQGADGTTTTATIYGSALAEDTRSIFLHGHADGGTGADAKHCRADVAGHFILRLACCGRGRCSDGNGNGKGKGKEASEEEREEDMGKARDRREWFVRAEKELFGARLQWHLHRTADGGGKGDGITTGGDGEGKDGPGVTNLGASSVAGQQHRRKRQRQQPQEVALDERCEALRVVYGLGWIRPVECVHHPERNGSGMRQGVDFSYARSGCNAGCDGGSGGSGDGDVDSGRGDVGAGSASNRVAVLSDGNTRCRGYDRPDTTGKASTRDALVTARHPTGGCRTYFSCPFEKALPLVRSRQVLLRDGMALLTPRQIPIAVLQHFENILRNSLAITARGLPGVEADERVRDVLQQVRNAVDAFMGASSLTNAATDGRSSVRISRSNIDAVADKHFPLCMRRTFRVLRREHHLKYQARLQLISFLSNAGMEVGEVLALWREEFPKGMSKEDYARKRSGYEYSVRHLYGLEGKRKVYTPMSCSRIASQGYGSGEGGAGHGCPFAASNVRSNKDESLREMLSDLKLPTGDIEDIVRPFGGAGEAGVGGWRGGNSGALSACRRHFAAAHRFLDGGGGGSDGRGWVGEGQEASPNGWIATSTRLYSHTRSEPPDNSQMFMRQDG